LAADSFAMQALPQNPNSGTQRILEAFRNSSVLLGAIADKNISQKLVPLTAKKKAQKQVAFKLGESLQRGARDIDDILQILQMLSELEGM
jgi:hypothetical protein